MSQVEVKVNKILGIVLVIQIILAFIAAILYGCFRNAHVSAYTYIDWSSYSTPSDSVIIFFSYFVLINTMIPISLIVSI
jgi:phospholipid-transporting ATPase